MYNISQQKTQPEFNFDEWCELSKKDPVSFESRRQQSIDELINNVSAEKQQRLRCLQWKIDRVRDKMPTPLAACVAMSDMMWDSLERLNRVYNDCDDITTVKDGKRVLKTPPSAKIVQLSSKR
ncbi:MAG: DUF3135 domain-containing protein [Gammaproteobacteria bacterium]|nr:DUF3135 domain-containing protein [Gammaproteobacteria bacterium]